eukprot:Skav218236  [mRNA]  locus=scaffold4566:164334:164585:- [translate_table: standard]
MNRSLHFDKDHVLQRCTVCKAGRNGQSTNGVSPTADALRQDALELPNVHWEGLSNLTPGPASEAECPKAAWQVRVRIFLSSAQ